MTFKPPPVEPAQPPIKEANTNKSGKKEGHALKSLVEKPAVVEIETDSNIACSTVSEKPP